MQVQLDELKALKQKMAEQAEQREEMNKINQQLHHFACLEKEESRLADLKVKWVLKTTRMLPLFLFDLSSPEAF